MKNKIPASQYCDRVFDGTHETPKPATMGYPLVTSKNILGGKLNLGGAYNISKEDYISIQKRSAVSRWDVLFSMIGSVGETYLEINNDIQYAIKNVGVFSCKDEYKAKWLYYYLLSPWAKKYISNYLNGAVQKFLPLGALRDFPIISYDKTKINLIDFLQNLDSKIDLNNRINTELESIAKTLYDYWFVQYDFPNTKGKPYKSSGGKMVYNPDLKREIPENWLVYKVGELLHTSLGGTPSTDVKHYWENGTINWLNSGEIANFPIVDSELKITEAAIRNSATELLPRGSTLLSITRHLRPTVLAIDACVNQSVVGIREKDYIKYYFLYPYLKNEIPRFLAMRTGAQQPHINKEIVDESQILIPNEGSNVLKIYNSKVRYLYELIINNTQQNHKLAELRDWLLPMLMNGQVKVN